MSERQPAPLIRPLLWVGSAREDLRAFPPLARREAGYALYEAQLGMKPLKAKPLKGLGGGLMEVVADHDGNTYRAVYTVKFAEALFVLHAFQKKSTKGIATPKKHIDLVKRRLRIAIDEYQRLYGR